MGDTLKYKLGLDLGSTSLGWAVVELADDDSAVRLVDMGVRIFPDGRDAKSHTPINVERRMARGMRRRNDRIQIRKKRTLQLIHKYGLDFDISSDIERLGDPYKLRARAVTPDQSGKVPKLASDELGRVLFHLALRRGFKSNRKETQGDDGGKLKAATVALSEKLGNQTLAQFQMTEQIYRFSNQFDGTKIKDGALYPTRDMYLDEFRRICNAQNISEQMRAEFEDAIFHQRPLLPPVIGVCLFEPNQPRAHKFEPIFQQWRALQQINQLCIIDNGTNIPLTSAQRAELTRILLTDFSDLKSTKTRKTERSFADMKKHLNLARTTKFNLESEKRTGLNIDTTMYAFYEIGEQEFWSERSESEQSDILARINDPKIEDADLIDYLLQQYAITSERAEKIINIPLDADVSNVSVMAMNKMLPFLRQGQMYHDAEESAGYHHSFQETKPMDTLPYYGEIDALKPSLVPDKTGQYHTPNATVHIALNQVRAVVNELISTYGKPWEINVEFGHSLRAGAKELAEIDKRQTANKKENDKIRAELATIGITNPSREDFQKYKLWEALDKNPLNRCCVYTGEPITSITELFKSGKFEIEHILPFAQTLDDSMANKTISKVEANRFKGNRTPYEAFNASDSPWKYDDVWARAQSLPDGSKWRFTKDALERYLKGNDCIARALNDTHMMSSMAIRYLKPICQNPTRVFGVPGRMTALFRDMWNLDWWKKKEFQDIYRANHIHHAIDAFVVAMVNQGYLRTLSVNATKLDNYFGKTQNEKRKQLFTDITTPFAGFNYEEFQQKCADTVISYRPSVKDPKKSGTVGCLHEETAYNLESFAKNNSVKATMSRRVQLPQTDNDRKKFQKDFKNLNPKTLQMFLADTHTTNDDPDIANKFLEWCDMRGIKKVRMLKDDVDTTIYIPIFRNKSDKDAYWAAYAKWYAAKDISSGISNKREKQAQASVEKQLLEQYQNAALRAYKWYNNGNNFCADVFEIRPDDKRYPKKAGVWQTEVISNYNTTLTKGAPMWRQKYATARRIMSLRINDMVMAEFSKNDDQLPKGLVDAVKYKCYTEGTDTVQMILRVKKISSNGIIYLRPHYVAKEDGDTLSWAASATSLQKYKARKVHISPTGKILK